MRGIGEHPDDGVGEGRGVTHGHQGGGVAEQVRHPPGAGGDQRRAGPQRLLSGERAALPPRGQHAEVGRGQQVGDVRAPAQQQHGEPLGADPVGQLGLQRTVAGDRHERHRPQPVIGGPAGDGIEQDVVALLRVQPADGHHQGPPVVEPQLCADVVPRARGGRQWRGERGDHPHVAGAEPPGVVGEVAGDGQHHVGGADRGALDGPQQSLTGPRALLQGVVQREHEGPLAGPRQPAGDRRDQPGAQPVGVQELGALGRAPQLQDRPAVGERREAGGDADRPEVGAGGGEGEELLGGRGATDAHGGTGRAQRWDDGPDVAADAAGARREHLGDPAAVQGRPLSHGAPPVGRGPVPAGEHAERPLRPAEPGAPARAASATPRSVGDAPCPS
jgi:hypothetical protein